MDFEEAKCPTCGADIMVPKGGQNIKCMYCGRQIEIKDTTGSQSGDRIENLIELAAAAAAAGNQGEAYSYYSRVLEIDPSHGRAWFERAIAAGWQSSLANPRLMEMVAGILTGIEKSGDSEVMKKAGAAIITNVSITYWSMVRKHCNEFASVNGVWEEYCAQNGQVAQALRTAYSLDPTYVDSLEILIMVHDDIIRGRTYSYGVDSWGHHALDKPTIDELKREIEDCTSKIISVKPDFRVESPESTGSKSPCFIATAACGDNCHPDVIVLRYFRDNHLLTNRLGRTITALYNRIGPTAARLIRGRKAICFVVRFVVVTPAACIARTVFRASDENRPKMSNILN